MAHGRDRDAATVPKPPIEDSDPARIGLPETAIGSGVLLARLAMLALLPTVLTLVAAACFVLLTRTPDGRLAEPQLLVGGFAAILAVTFATQLAWVLRTTRGVIASVEELVRAIDAADAAALESLRRRPDWEISLLYRRVRTLLTTRAEANEEYRALLHAHRQVEAAADVLDRVATAEPPGDAGGFTGFLSPMGTSLRALMERLDRREANVGSRIAGLRRAVSAVGEEVGGVAGRFESAFMGLLEVVSSLKDGRHAVPAIERELERAGHARAMEMVGRLGSRIDETLAALADVSSQLEASATATRRLASRGALLARAAEQITTANRPEGASRTHEAPDIIPT